MNEAVLEPTTPIRLPAGPVGRHGAGWWALVCALASESVLFAYLLFTYYYNAVESGYAWPPGEMPRLNLSLPNTIILLISSGTVWLAERAARRNKRWLGTFWLVVTFILGCVFLFIQLLEWHSKKFTIITDSYGSVFFTVTGFHMAHVVVGVIGLALGTAWCALGYFNERRHVPMVIVSTYWHFVDAVWLTVFFTFYITPRLWLS